MNTEIILPAIIGAVSALGVFWLSHLADRAKENTKLLTEKLEVLFDALIRLDESSAVADPDKWNACIKQGNQINTEVRKSEIIIELYFPSLRTDFIEIKQTAKRLRDRTIEGENVLREVLLQQAPNGSYEEYTKNTLIPIISELCYTITKMKEKMICDKELLTQKYYLYN